MYLPSYKNSWALIIGINSYPTAPLTYARQDAEAIHKTISKTFGFKEEHITVLLDEDANRSAITESFLRYASLWKSPQCQLGSCRHALLAERNRTIFELICSFIAVIEARMSSMSSTFLSEAIRCLSSSR